MKKIIFSFGLLMLTLSGYPQSGSIGGASSTSDSMTNPTGTGFGGSMGGATSPSTAPATAPAGSTASPNAVTPGTGGNQQQMQDIPSGSNVPSTTAPAPASNLPSGTGSTSEPTAVPRTTVPSATGVGTGSPTSF